MDVFICATCGTQFSPAACTRGERVRGVLETLEFDSVYGEWWGSIVVAEANTEVLRSADRYVAALMGDVESRVQRSSSY